MISPEKPMQPEAQTWLTAEELREQFGSTPRVIDVRNRYIAQGHNFGLQVNFGEEVLPFNKLFRLTGINKWLATESDTNSFVKARRFNHALALMASTQEYPESYEVVVANMRVTKEDFVYPRAIIYRNANIDSNELIFPTSNESKNVYQRVIVLVDGVFNHSLPDYEQFISQKGYNGSFREIEPIAELTARSRRLGKSYIFDSFNP